MSASAEETILDRGVRAVRLENETMATTVLIDKGADLYELIYKPAGIDILWKSPWGLRRPAGGFPTAGSDMASWLEWYAGGWQVLFPSGGGPCVYKGATLNFHGEASAIAWDVQSLRADSDGAALSLSTRLARSPFLIEREMVLEPERPILHIRERITNQGAEEMAYMWGHHPAFGAPFLSEACQIDTNATSLIADDQLNGPGNPLQPGENVSWPTGRRGEQTTDLGQIPPPGSGRSLLAYFGDYRDETAWYAVTNRELGFGVGLAWSRAAFPHAWYWQEMNASAGYPWYQGVYVMAIEPNTSYPGQGLVAVSEKTQTERSLLPGGTAEAELTAVLYGSRTGVDGIDLDGTVHVRGEGG